MNQSNASGQERRQTASCPVYRLAAMTDSPCNELLVHDRDRSIFTCPRWLPLARPRLLCGDDYDLSEVLLGSHAFVGTAHVTERERPIQDGSQQALLEEPQEVV